MDFYKLLEKYMEDEETVNSIIKKFGGKTKYIPKNIHKKHVFFNYGEKFCSFLEDHYAGSFVYFPVYKDSEHKNAKQHNNIIVRLYKKLLNASSR